MFWSKKYNMHLSNVVEYKYKVLSQAPLKYLKCSSWVNALSYIAPLTADWWKVCMKGSLSARKPLITCRGNSRSHPGLESESARPDTRTGPIFKEHLPVQNRRWKWVVIHKFRSWNQSRRKGSFTWRERPRWWGCREICLCNSLRKLPALLCECDMDCEDGKQL